VLADAAYCLSGVCVEWVRGTTPLDCKSDGADVRYVVGQLAQATGTIRMRCSMFRHVDRRINFHRTRVVGN
jgi:hypothetical protein